MKGRVERARGTAAAWLVILAAMCAGTPGTAQAQEAPTTLSAEAISPYDVRLTWDRPPHPAHLEITGYLFEGSFDGVNWTFSFLLDREYELRTDGRPGIAGDEFQLDDPTPSTRDRIGREETRHFRVAAVYRDSQADAYAQVSKSGWSPAVRASTMGYAAAHPLTNFVLRDRGNLEGTYRITDGDTLTLANPESGSYSIQATTENVPVGSIHLVLDGPARTDHERTANSRPWSLYGEQGGLVVGRPLPEGSYTLTATAYEAEDRSGVQLDERMVNFLVLGGALRELSLIDAYQDSVKGPIPDGATISVKPERPYSFRARVASGAQVRSVTLELEHLFGGTVSRTDNTEPYTLYPSNNNEHDGTPLEKGAYTLTATAYGQSDGGGDPLDELTVKFTVKHDDLTAIELLRGEFQNMPEHHGGATGAGANNITNTGFASAANFSRRNSQALDDGPPDNSGSASFEIRIQFSEEVTIDEGALEEHALKVDNGSPSNTRRDGEDTYNVLITPDSDDDVTITLEGGVECDEPGAICTDDGRQLDETLSATVLGPNTAALTARFKSAPETHDGEDEFHLELAFSEEVQLSYRKLEGGALNVSGGSVSGARRAERGSNLRWDIGIAPDGDADVTVTLPPTADCADDNAVCTADGKALSAAATATVQGPGTDTPPPNTEATGAPSISGTARVGETLSASTSDISDDNGLENAAFAYQWIRGDADIDGAAGSSYTLVDADYGERIRVRASFTDNDGYEESRTSGGTEQVTARPSEPATNTEATGAPSISGTARVGETLTASSGDIADANGLDNASFSYQWLRNGAEIGGATGSSYTLVEADQGKTIKVRASFTDDENHEESRTSSATDEVAAAPQPLTASFSDVPSEHAGAEETFTFTLGFSEEFAVSYRTLRDEAFDVTGGEVTRARRQQAGKNRNWTIHVEASGHGPVSVRLPETSDCNGSGAICTADGRPLSQSLSASVAGPVGISANDAKVEENEGAVVAFAVTLSRGAAAALTVDYQTSDGSAQAGVDYTAASGTLSFAAGETSKTIEVEVLDDAHDEGEETFTLRLSNASNGRITDAEATGTIENRDPLPRALLARFGRAAATHVVEQVEERLLAPREPGIEGRFAGRELQPGTGRTMALSLLNQLGGAGRTSGYDGYAGRTMPGAGRAVPGNSNAQHGHRAGLNGIAGGEAGMGLQDSGLMNGTTGRMGPMGGAAGGGLFDGGMYPLSLGDSLLTGSAIAVNRESRGGILSFWSRSARSRFAGREGTLGLSGDVRTTMFGTDYAKGPMVAGLSLSHSRGLGEYTGVAAGRVGSAVTGLYPWLGYRANERVTVWGVAGYGRGGLLLTPQSGAALESGLSMAMAAAGTRGEIMTGGAGGFALAFKADALWVGTAIDGVDGPAGRLKATRAGITRLRTGLEGSRSYAFGRRFSMRPRVEVGLRQDGGDAETGAGMDVGGGLVLADAASGLAIDLRMRMLVVHQAEGFRDHGMAMSLSYNPTPSTPLGFTARVTPAWGGQATSGAQALWGRDSMGGMGQHGFSQGNGINGEVGYGLPVGRRLVGTPRIGFATSDFGRDYRIGYGLGIVESDRVNFQLGFDAHRREMPMLESSDNGFLGRATLGW